MQRAQKLKGEVTALLEKTTDPFDQIELLDVLQKLGIFYHFTHYVERILKNIHILGDSHGWNIESLHATALRFRLLRQHGYNVSAGTARNSNFVHQMNFHRTMFHQMCCMHDTTLRLCTSFKYFAEVFRNFMDEAGNFKAALCNDLKGLISLYEASYLSVEGESIMDEAQVFVIHHLKEKLNQNINQNLAEEIAHALELPFHWRMLRLESRWFIDAYERRWDTNPLLLELAKLDFNIVQTMYQDELKELSRYIKLNVMGKHLIN